MSEFESKALVDWSGFGKTIGDVQGSFSLLEFLDFCTILEGMVLYDKLVLVGYHENKKWKNQLKNLQVSGILSEEQVSSRPLHIVPQHIQNIRGAKVSDIKLARSSIIDSYYETSRLLGAEKETGLPCLPLLRQRSVYEKYASVREEHTFFNLISQYKDLSYALQEIRKSNRYNLRPYYIVPIPPIPLMILNRSNKKEDFLTVCIDLREEMKPLRQSLTELREILDDKDIPLSEKISYRNSWEKTWGTLGQYKESSFHIDLADASKDKISIEKSIDGIGIDSLQLTKILEMMIKSFGSYHYSKKIRVLHKAAKNYITSSDGEMNRMIEKFYNHEVTIKDFDRLNRTGIVNFENNV